MLCQSGIQLLSVHWIKKHDQMAKGFNTRQEEPTQQSDPDQLFKTLNFCHERWKHIMVFPRVCSAPPWRSHQSEWEFKSLMSLKPRGTTLAEPRDNPQALSKAHNKSRELALRSNAYLCAQHNK